MRCVQVRMAQLPIGGTKFISNQLTAGSKFEYCDMNHYSPLGDVFNSRDHRRKSQQLTGTHPRIPWFAEKARGDYCGSEDEVPIDVVDQRSPGELSPPDVSHFIFERKHIVVD